MAENEQDTERERNAMVEAIAGYLDGAPVRQLTA